MDLTKTIKNGRCFLCGSQTNVRNLSNNEVCTVCVDSAGIDRFDRSLSNVSAEIIFKEYTKAFPNKDVFFFNDSAYLEGGIEESIHDNGEDQVNQPVKKQVTVVPQQMEQPRETKKTSSYPDSYYGLQLVKPLSILNNVSAIIMCVLIYFSTVNFFGLLTLNAESVEAGPLISGPARLLAGLTGILVGGVTAFINKALIQVFKNIAVIAKNTEMK